MGDYISQTLPLKQIKTTLIARQIDKEKKSLQSGDYCQVKV